MLDFPFIFSFLLNILAKTRHLFPAVRMKLFIEISSELEYLANIEIWVVGLFILQHYVLQPWLVRNISLWQSNVQIFSLSHLEWKICMLSFPILKNISCHKRNDYLMFFYSISTEKRNAIFSSLRNYVFICNANISLTAYKWKSQNKAC